MLYILHEKIKRESSTKIKRIVDLTKKLSYKKINIKIISTVDEAYTIFEDKDAVLFIPYKGTNYYAQLIEDCNKCNVPVIIVKDDYIDFYNFYCCAITDNLNYYFKTLLTYFNQYQKSSVAVFGANISSASDKQKIVGLYYTIPEFTSDDVYYKKQFIKDCFEEFFPKRYNYDSIVCAHDFCAMAFIKLMQENDPDYLKDRFVLGFSDTLLSRLYSTPITTTAYNLDDLVNAVHSIYLILKKSNSKKIAYNAKLECHLIARDSTYSLPVDPEFSVNVTYHTKPEFVFPPYIVDSNFFDDEIISDYLKIDDFITSITVTELKIVYYILNKMSKFEIANELLISEHTVKVYQKRIYLKAGVSGKQELYDLMAPNINLNYLKDYINECEKGIYTE